MERLPISVLEMIKITTIFFVTAAILAAVTIYHHPPGQNPYYPPCFFKKWTGYDCAGCGSTRACFQLMHGNIRQAADHNIMLLLFIPVMAIGLLNAFGKKMQVAWQYLNKPLIVLCFILLFWIIRNIPFPAFMWLHSDK